MSVLSFLGSSVLALSAQQGTAPDATAVDPRLEAHRRMLRVLAELGDQAYHTNPIFGLDQVERLRAQRAATDDGTPREELMQLFPALGLQELFLGNDAEAVELLERTRALVFELPAEKRPQGMPRLTYNLAVACLRLGETQNCVARHTSESCLLPIQGSGVHVDQEGSRMAIGYLLEVLAMEDVGEDMRLGARWLLNLAHIGIDALIRGGTLDIGAESRGGASEIVVRATGPRIAFDGDIGRALEGSLPIADLSSRTAPAWMLQQLAQQQGGGLQFALSDDALVMGAVLPEG